LALGCCKSLKSISSERNAKMNRKSYIALFGVSLVGLGIGIFVYKKRASTKAKGIKFSVGTPALNTLKSIKEPALLKLVMDKYDFDAKTKTRYFWNSEEVDDSIDDWYPASTVKYLAAAGALERLSKLGFNSEDTTVTFHYKNGKNPTVVPFTDILNKAIVNSDNTKYNQLVQVAGHQRLHDTILADYDLHLSRPYVKDAWQKLTGSREFDSPQITLQDTSGKSVILEADSHQAPRACPSRSSCARLSSFTDSIYDLVLGGRFDISDSNRSELLRVLSAKKPRGDTFLDAILSQISNEAFDVYHKAGFAINYYSDSILLVSPSGKKAYAISAVGFKGRDSLTDLGKAIGQLINDGVV